MPARCGASWPGANDVCGETCHTNTDCTNGTCWGGLTLPCNASLTSRCGLRSEVAASSCDRVCHGIFAPGGCAGALGRPCGVDADCGGDGLRCFSGLPTWPCSITSAAQRCGSTWREADRTCGKVCMNRGNCEVECHADLDESACTGGSTPSASPPTPPPTPRPWVHWRVASVCEVLGGCLAAFGLALWARYFWVTRARSVTRAKRLQASAQGLESQARILRHGSWKWWPGELRAKYLAASAERKRLRATKTLARAAAAVAGGPEFWGMTVDQLLAFREEHLPRLKAYCEDHRLAEGDRTHVCLQSPCPHDHGDADYRPRCACPEKQEEALQPLPLNMHLVVALVIRPSTREHMGTHGYAVLLNRETPKKAETFISHCWNELFEDFTRTLGTLRRETVVWVCSFALPQNIDIGRLLCNDLASCPFAKALLASDRVLLVVDDAVEPLTRSWCCYEVYLAVKNRQRFELRPPQTSTDMYRTVRAKLAAMDIRRCNASNESDHGKIMKAIRGSEDVVNSKIREIVEDTLAFLESHVP